MSSLIVRYALERLLYRISVSSHAQEFCLKGAILLAAYSDEDDLTRPTADLDLNGFAEDGSIRLVEEAILSAIEMDLPEDDGVAFDTRSEEHTSELQSLMRISYAASCLKKKTTTNR